MACPFLKRGLLTARCMLTGKIVNLKKAPCLKNYKECPEYKKYIEEERKKRGHAAEDEHVNEEKEKAVEEVIETHEEETEVHEEVEVPPGVSCKECVYYSELTGYCVKVKQKVKDPERPPCGGKYFRKAAGS